MLHYLNPTHPAPVVTTRRTFLKLSAGAAGGLLLGATIPGHAVAQTSGTDALQMPFVHVRPDNTVVVMVKHLDKGQGAATGLATLVADELDAAPEQLRAEFAPSNPEVYKNLLFGVQGTGGSTAIANSFDQYRQAGAMARAMLVAAAAESWGVPADQITIAKGRLSAGDRSASFGELAEAAATQEMPAEVTLKSPEDWIYIGKGMPRVELPSKTVGSVGMFGIDARPNGERLVAVAARPPRFGGQVGSVDDSAALAIDGVEAVLPLPFGVAVVARDTWTAILGRDALEISWDDSAAEMRGTDALMAEYQALLDQPGNSAPARGDAAAKLDAAATVIEADYAFPFLNHAQMEPLNVTVFYDGSRAEFWFGSQIQTLDHGAAAAVLGLEFPQIAINTTWAGGSFGRRATPDAHLTVEAAMLAKSWYEATGSATPIQLVYTREDDMQSGYFRPMHLHRVRAGVDADGKISGWQHRIVGQGIMIGTPFESFTVHDGVDHSSTEGTIDTTYSIPDFALDAHHPETGVPVLWWRSVGHTHTAYVMETMMDALADAAGQDPVAFRLAHLGDDPRKAAVLRLAAEKAGWDTPAADGIHRGVAVHKSFNSYVAEVAEVRMREDGTVKVEKVVCAVDCGVPVNPDNIRAQIEGGLGYGLSAVLREEITMTDGVVDQLNYPDYPALRISDMPEIEVHIIASTEAPTGVGEPGTPPIGPAVANAVYRATGTRVLSLPMSKHGLA